MYRLDVFGQAYYFDEEEQAERFCTGVSMPRQSIRYDMTANKDRMEPHEGSGGWVYAF